MPRRLRFHSTGGEKGILADGLVLVHVALLDMYIFWPRQVMLSQRSWEVLPFGAQRTQKGWQQFHGVRD